MYPPIKREEEAATSCGSGPPSGPLFAIHHQWAGSNQQDIEMPSSDGTTDRSFASITVKVELGEQTEHPSASNVASIHGEFRGAVAPQARNLHVLLARANAGNISPEELEAAVKTGVQAIDTLMVTFQQYAEHPAAAMQLKSLSQLRARALPTRTVVGVVGNTGAGKSSVINALLDEERSVS